MIVRWATALALSLALVACTDRGAKESSTVSAATPTVKSGADLTPEQMGELGARITKNAERSKQILQEHGLDEQTFEQKIRAITEDPEASRRYAAAFRKAKA
ncbi:MAG TPA: hypothetical protein VND45_08115 [Thermoanaerobaculia bacterium]|nr:hypothetical protein [Thermoanaerobaculia bacterium]